MTGYRDTAEIIAAERARGSHFFDPDTMRAFGSRILDGVTEGAWFVTSERDRDRGMGAAWDGRRRYTVRYARPSGGFSEGEGFGRFGSAREARAAIARWVAEGVTLCPRCLELRHPDGHHLDELERTWLDDHCAAMRAEGWGYDAAGNSVRARGCFGPWEVAHHATLTHGLAGWDHSHDGGPSYHEHTPA